MLTIGVEVHRTRWVKKRWIEGVVGLGTKPEERERGVKTLGEAKGWNRMELINQDLKLSLRGVLRDKLNVGRIS